jgi:hypothetical protein
VNVLGKWKTFEGTGINSASVILCFWGLMLVSMVISSDVWKNECENLACAFTNWKP